MLNLTPHAISVMDTNTGEVIVLPPSGTIARVSTTEVVVGTVSVTDPVTGVSMTVPVIDSVFGEVVGLPEEGELCVVSGMVASAVPGRAGVFSPDTGKTCVRNEAGQVAGVTRLKKA